MATKTQKQKILDVLQSGRVMTITEAVRRNIPARNLSRRIADLRSEGFVIYTNSRRLQSGPNRGKLVTEYSLDSRFRS